ncbi:MAG: hypothetical protein NC122_06095 [Faecalibacterium sp.]|nr:hypothetical protein [Ruminococcus sp.]MCM1391630.1 hypothetical protein [Ruminococcus sp.]MCM1485761.1 hypothetical protein [Faecalibacterium sp.]
MRQKLLNDKDYVPGCALCKNGHVPKDNSVILCKYKGITNPDDSCKKFKYDPLKRVPTKIKISTDFSEEDFKL